MPPPNRFYNAFDLATLTPRPSPEGEYRSAFQIDRDRIIHTSAFRRLQSKTQVFLSGEYDFYRTRLTHSIEVAQIGRSICGWLQQNSPNLSDDCFIDPDLVECACLSHDLGHPPFGHTGERTLHRLMRPYGGFEGNAQTLRLLTQTLFSERKQGIAPDVKAQASLNKRIAYELVFRSPQLQQLDHKADFILTRMFEVLRDRYIEHSSNHLHLHPADVESDIEQTDHVNDRARLICDWIASMTDRFAFRTYRRLFDADFGSITDFV